MRRVWLAALVLVSVAAAAVGVALALDGSERTPRTAARPTTSTGAATSSSTTTTTAPTPMPTRFLLVGDSIASSLGDALAREAAARGISLVPAARSGCNMTTAIPLQRDADVPTQSKIDCSRQTASYQSENIARHQPEVVLWLSSWEPTNHLYDGVRLDFNTPEGDAALLADFEQSRQRLTAGGATLVMLTMPAPAEVSDIGPADQDLVWRYAALNALFRRFASMNLDTVKVVDLARIVCPTGAPCPEYMDGVRLRPTDGGHYHPDGAAWVAPRLLDAILRQLADPADLQVR